MLAKSQRRAYVGFDDGSKSILYYNAKTRKVLTSRNYRFLSITNKTPLEEIVVAPDNPHEAVLFCLPGVLIRTAQKHSEPLRI